MRFSKITALAGLLCFLLSTSACKKDRTCRCTVEGTMNILSFDTLLTAVTKKEGKKDCSEFNDGGDDGIGNNYTINCELIK